MPKQLGDYIEAAVEKIGSVKQVAEMVGVSRSSLSCAKSHRHGIPTVSCIVLAEIVGAEPLEVIAANELVTETKEEKRAILLPFVNEGGWRRGSFMTLSYLKHLIHKKYFVKVRQNPGLTGIFFAAC